MRIVLFRTDRLGDVVISSALQSAIQQAYPEAKVYFCAKRTYGTLLYAPGNTDRFIAWENSTAEALNKLQVDLSIHLHPDPVCAERAQQAGIPQRIGYASDSQFLTQTIPYNKDDGLKHELAYCLELVQTALPKILDGGAPVLPVSPWRRTNILPRIVIHCGSHGSKAKLPPRILADCAQSFLPPIGNPEIALIGTKEESALAELTMRELKSRKLAVQNLTGTLSFPALAELIANSALFIGRDSGPVHIAAATGCPTFCIFPVTRPDVSPTRWRPLGPRVHVYEVPAKPWPWQKNATAAEKAFAKINSTAIQQSLDDFLQQAYA